MQLRIVEHGTVDSTSERAFAALASGEALHGDVHVAREQTHGRGRRGASWSSSPGGLYMSIVLRPPPPPPHPAELTMAAGLAVQGALVQLGVRARLKWPNDVLVGDAKLAGILAETRGLEPERPHCVLGIGVNVEQRSFPPELTAERTVTSLALEGCTASVGETRELLLSRLSERLELQPGARNALAEEYFAALGLRGKQVIAVGPEGEQRGIANSLSFERGLVLELATGARASLALEHVRSVNPT